MHDETEERIPQRAMRELVERASRRYQRAVDSLWEDLLRYIGKHVVPGARLTKAEDDEGGERLSLLTPAQLEAVKAIVREHHLAYAVNAVGTDALPPADLRRLQRVGLVPLHIQRMRLTDLAYLYGRHVGAAQREDPAAREEVGAHDLDSFVHLVELGKVGTTPVDEHAMEAARQQAGQYIRGIGERLAHDIGVSIMDAQAEARRRYIGTVRSKLEDAIDRKDEWRKLASTLAHETQDWGRDMHRLAATEMQSAMEEGTARALSEGRDPKSVRVAKLTAGGACDHCVELYRTDGQGSAPRIFTLHELAANGTNVGRRAKDFRAVVGPTHPFCFPAGTTIQTERGLVPIERVTMGTMVWTHQARLRAVSRLSQREHAGDLVTVHTEHGVLQSTPEHPLLTKRGWVPAHAIQIGDELLKIHHHTTAHADAENRPLNRSERGVLLGVLRSLPFRGVPVAGIDLDGHEELWQSEIDRERSDGELWGRVVTGLAECVSHLALERGHRSASLERLRAAKLLDERPWLAAEGCVGRLRSALSLAWSACSGMEESLLAQRSNRDATSDEARGDRRSGGTEPLRDDVHALTADVGDGDGTFIERERPRPEANTALAETANDGARGGSESERDALCTLAAAVRILDTFLIELESSGHAEVHYHTAPVTSTKSAPFVGTVYNFAVDGDETYVASGFVVHNCHCTLVEVPDGWGFNGEGHMVPESLIGKSESVGHVMPYVLDLLEKAIGAERPGHKYKSRKKGANGEWEYEYDEPGGGSHAERFLAAKTPREQAEIFAAWNRDDFAGWASANGMKHFAPGARERTAKAAQQLLAEVSDPSHVEHRDALGFLAETRGKILDAPKRAAESKQAAKREREDAKWEAQGIEVEEGTSPSKLRGKKVWLWHGTSSKLVPKIETDGLHSSGRTGTRSTVGRTGFVPASDRVFLTARRSGEASAEFYARGAARRHGGEPVIIRVLVDGDDLARDRDDADIGSGGFQYETDSVEPDQIMEINGKRRGRLAKAEDIRPHMTHDAIAGDSLTIRIADPRVHSLVAQICAEAPPALFRRDVGVTLITTDHPRAQNPLDDHDFAYWTGNEIRLSQTLPIERLPRVLRHELGHAPNVYLMRKLGSATEVRAWHDALWKISQDEGWCSDYADRAPIENAAEVTRMYMFERPRLMVSSPKQFTFVHRAYDGIFDRPMALDTLVPENG